MKRYLILALLLLATPDVLAATPPSCLFAGFFDVDSAVLSEKFEHALHEVYAKGSYCAENFGETKDSAFRGIVIQGNAGASDALDRMTLSRARAEAIRDYLVSLGLPRRAMKLVANGATKPFAKRWGSSLDVENVEEENRYATIMFTFDPL